MIPCLPKHWKIISHVSCTQCYIISHRWRLFKKLAETPDVIILDYYLNTVQKDAANGIEILQAIRKHYPNIRVIMLSSQERYSIAMKTIQKGAEQYVIKDENAFEKIAQIIDAMS